MRRPAHVARVLAVAHRLNAAIEGSLVADQGPVSRMLGLTRAPTAQLLDLTLLAPDLRRQVLELEAMNGVEPLAARHHANRGASWGFGTWPQQPTAWAGTSRLNAKATWLNPCKHKLLGLYLSSSADSLLSRLSTSLAQKDAHGRQVAFG